MKISYLWLRDYIDVAVPPEELREALSAVGLVVESVQADGEDAILDLEIPSNRPDCLSHIGIARELAAIYDLDLKIPSPPEFSVEGCFPVRIEASELCRRYSAQAVRGVKIGPSPEWMQRRLAAVGQRPINNIVDVTNYVLLEMGHPLHAFDLTRLAGPEIVVRVARPGEILRTLDGVDRRLDSGHLVIADARRPVALAGIMGGEQSEITPASTDLLIESAYFDPACIGRTARGLQIRTEASHRFERGANQEATLPALKRCVELIVNLAAGTVATPVIDVVAGSRSLPVVPLRSQKMQQYSIIEIPGGFVRRTLGRLEFQVEGNAGGWMVKVPSHRVDVSLEEDLIEEVLRHYGYDKIPSALPRWNGKGGFLPETERRRRLAELFRALGYSETLNWTLTDPGLEGLFGYLDSPVVLKNPLSVEASRLRTHLLPNLLLAARHNWNHGQERVRLFEVGKAFVLQADADAVVEKEHAAWVAIGEESRKFWHHHDDPLNFFYVKGVLESLVHGAGMAAPELRPAQAGFLNPAQSAELYSNGGLVGCVGCLHPDLQETLKLREPLFLGEFNLSQLSRAAAAQISYTPISRYPGVFRDFSFLVDRKITFDALMDSIAGRQAPHLKQVELIDLYDSEQLPPGKISLAIRLFFESPERTLTDEEIQESRDRIVQELQEAFGVIPR